MRTRNQRRNRLFAFGDDHLYVDEQPQIVLPTLTRTVPLAPEPEPELEEEVGPDAADVPEAKKTLKLFIGAEESEAETREVMAVVQDVSAPQDCVVDRPVNAVFMAGAGLPVKSRVVPSPMVVRTDPIRVAPREVPSSLPGRPIRAAFAPLSDAAAPSPVAAATFRPSDMPALPPGATFRPAPMPAVPAKAATAASPPPASALSPAPETTAPTVRVSASDSPGTNAALEKFAAVARAKAAADAKAKAIAEAKIQPVVVPPPRPVAPPPTALEEEGPSRIWIPMVLIAAVVIVLIWLS